MLQSVLFSVTLFKKVVNFFEFRELTKETLINNYRKKENRKLTMNYNKESNSTKI